MKEKKYPLGETLKRMLHNAWRENKGLFGKSFCYMVIAGIYPFFAVLLPKLLIGVLERSAGQTGQGISGAEIAALQIGGIVLAYFLAAGLFAFLQKFIHDRDYNAVSMLRLNCLAVTFDRLMTMDYKYREDAHFLDQYQMAFTATSTNDNGVEGIYHKLYDLPAQVLSILILAVLVGIANPLILLGLAGNILVGLWVQNLSLIHI